MTESKYGDYQLDLDGLENTIDVGTDQIYGVIVSTKEGNDYGMRHVENIWRGTELAWSTGFTTQVHGCLTSSAHYKSMMGQHINKVTYYTSKGIYTIPVNDIFVPTKFEASVSVEDASLSAGKTTMTVTGLPADYDAEYSVDGLDGFAVDGNTISYSANAKKGMYTLTIHDKKGVYADLTQSFTLYTDAMPAAYNEKGSAPALVKAENASEDDFADYIKNITSVKVNGKEYADDLYSSISPEVFYKMIGDGAQPVTSQVNAEAYCALFEPVLKSGKDVLHLTLSSGISGSINSANVAKTQMEEKYPDRRVIAVDSLAASSGYGMLVEQTLENQRAGMSLEENAAWIVAHRNTLHHWFFSTDLTFYIRGGRISKASGFFGTMLNICPLLNMDDQGKLIPRFKIRTKKKVIRAVVDKMEEYAEGGLDYSGKCYISQSACIEDAREVARLVEERFPKLNGKVEINNIGTTIGSHTGPGTVALFFWGNKRTA